MEVSRKGRGGRGLSGGRGGGWGRSGWKRVKSLEGVEVRLVRG